MNNSSVQRLIRHDMCLTYVFDILCINGETMECLQNLETTLVCVNAEWWPVYIKQLLCVAFAGPPTDAPIYVSAEAPPDASTDNQTHATTDAPTDESNAAPPDTPTAVIKDAPTDISPNHP